ADSVRVYTRGNCAKPLQARKTRRSTASEYRGGLCIRRAGFGGGGVRPSLAKKREGRCQTQVTNAGWNDLSSPISAPKSDKTRHLLRVSILVVLNREGRAICKRGGRQEDVQSRYNIRALADRRGHALGRFCSHIADRKDPTPCRFQ